jgi:hypothetical protein
MNHPEVKLRETVVRSPAEAKNFSSSLCVQTSCGAKTASYPMDNRGLSPGVKHGRGMTIDHSAPSSAKGKNEEMLYFLSPLLPAWW